MNPILKNIIKQTGASYVRMRSVQEEEYLLTYDSTLKLCVGFVHDREAAYYNSCSWSCDAVCYIVFTDDVTYMYSPLLKEADKYETAFILERIEDFFKYTKRFRIKEYQRVFNYLCKRFVEVDPELLTKDGDLYLKVLSSFFGGRDAEVDELVRDTFDLFREGFYLGDNIVVPDIMLIKKIIAPQLLDVVSLIFNFDIAPMTTLARLGSNSYRGVAANFIPDHIIRHLLVNHIKTQKDAGEFRIFIPYIHGCYLLLQCVRALRDAGYEGRIQFTTHSPIELPQAYYDIVGNLIDDEMVSWNPVYEVGLDADFPDEQDFVISFPPYRLYSKLLDKIHEDQGVEYLEFDTVEELPFYIAAQAAGALRDNGSLHLLVPYASLNADEFKNLREKILEDYSITSVEMLGSQLYSHGIGAMCFIRLKKLGNGTESKLVDMKWCEKSIESLDQSIRECNKRRMGGMNDKPELVNYRVPASYIISSNDWAPQPYSEFSLKLQICSNDAAKMVPAGSLFNIMSGVRTGFNQAFIIPADFYAMLPQEEQIYFTPSADRISLRNGMLSLNSYVFYPYGEGLAKIETEKNLQRKLRTYYDYIIKYKSYLLERKKNTKTNWWDLGYRTVSHNPGTPKLLSLGYGNVGSFAYDPVGLFVVTNGYQWVAKKKVLMSDEIYYSYMAILSSSVFWKLVAIYSEPFNLSAGNIKFKLSKKVVESIPIPDLSKPIYSDRIAVLCEYGRLVSQGRMEDIINELNKLVNDIYGYIPEQ